MGRTTWSLPLANEGWQMYHPPLYYGSVAALLSLGGWPADSPLGMLVLRLFQALLEGGGRAAGWPRVGLTPGARADVVVIDRQQDALGGVPMDNLLDALVFATDLPALAPVR